MARRVSSRFLAVMVVAASLVAATPALSQASAASVRAEKLAVEHVVSTLFRGLEHGDYRLACRQYATKARALLVLVAEHSKHPPAVRDRAHALALIEKPARAHLNRLGAVHFAGVRIDGRSAHAIITEKTLSQSTKTASIPLILGPHGWKVEVGVTSTTLPPTTHGVSRSKSFSGALRR
ncbi:MAG TPA: hypothetical protein VHX66_07405 [Solirubrobacteraceae bacterium]|nr:hypothetical protein [Solirubrobacteraceae bacterium]